MKLLFILSLLSSCASLKNQPNDIYLQNIFIDKDVMISFLDHSRQSLNNNILPKAFQIVKDYIEDINYNELVVNEAKEQDDFRRNKEKFLSYISKKEFKLIEKKKVEGDPKAFELFFKNFKRTKSNLIRVELIKKIILKDYPNLEFPKFMTILKLLITKHDNNYLKNIIYSNSFKELSSILINLNLYSLKNVTTKQLKAAVKIQKEKDYTQSRIFLSKVQSQVHKSILRVLINKFKHHNIEVSYFDRFLNALSN